MKYNYILYFISFLFLATLSNTHTQNQKIEQYPKITWGVSERQGKRSTMEDAYCARDIHPLIKKLKLPANSLHKTIAPHENYQMYGIFDGHGGKKAAEIASRRMPDLYAKIDARSIDIMIKKAFEATHKRIIGETDSGTTAIVALLRRKKLYIAWSGDARAVLEKNGRCFYSTKDHKPDNPKEKSAIEARGGHVENIYGVPRVQGNLAIARALGDRDIAQYITAEPDIKVIGLTPENHFLILACDGVWDVLSNEEAIAIAKDSLAKQNPNAAQAKRKLSQEQTTENGNNISAQFAARALIDAAYTKGSTDNISALVVVFNWENKIMPKKEIKNKAIPKKKIKRRYRKLKIIMRTK